MTGIRRAAERREQEIVVLHSASSAGLERVDGVIGESKSPEWYRQLPVAVPFIAVNAARPDLCCVEFDHRDGALQATRHLVGLGHRRIGHLLYLDAEVVSERLRSEGYRAGLREAGIDPLPVWERQLRDYGDFVVRGRRNMTEWLADGFVKTGITALLVQNDRAAIGAMQALHQAGLRVPQDISIVGFDGTDECELSTPRLTSVRAPLEAAGESAVEGLLRQITEGVGAPQTVVLPVELELRDSTAPPG